MELHFDDDVPPRVQRLLAKAGAMLDYRSNGVGTNYLGDLVLTCPMPTGWKRRMNHYADRVEMRVCRCSGRVFEVSEVSDGISGGFMASCIPVSFLEAALAAWIASAEPAQLDLFGVAA